MYVWLYQPYRWVWGPSPSRVGFQRIWCSRCLSLVDLGGPITMSHTYPKDSQTKVYEQIWYQNEHMYSMTLFCHSCCNAFHCHQWFLLINKNIPRDHWSFKHSHKATHHTSHQGTKPSEISYGIAKSARKSKRHPDVTETSPWMTSDQPNMCQTRHF